MRILLLLLSMPLAALSLAPEAHAQAPSGAEILSDWREGWRAAASGVDVVALSETLDRTVDGPRGDISMRTESRLRYTRSGDLSRRVVRAELEGRRAGPAARSRFETRAERAFGDAAGLLSRPAPLPGLFLNDATAEGGTAPDRLNGVNTWRVRVTTPTLDRPATLWFTRSETPELLRIRAEQSLPRRGVAVFEADYRRVRGLDLPESLRTTVTLRQRRRLREYEVSLHARGTYHTPRLVRE